MKSLHARDPRKFKVAPLCKLFGMTKQAYYKSINKTPSKEGTIEREIVALTKQIRAVDPGMGSDKLWVIYQKSLGQEWPVGKHKFRKILGRHNLLLKRRKKSIRTTDSRNSKSVYPNLVKSLKIERPNQVWVADLTYIYLHNGDDKKCFCFVSSVMDAYTHEVVGISVGDTRETVYTLDALKMAVAAKKTKKDSLKGLIHHSDRGAQYLSDEYTSYLTNEGIEISVTQSGNPKDNALAERWNETLKEELFKDKKFKTMDEVVAAVKEKVPFYNEVRPHKSNGMLTPKEAAKKTGRLRKYWHSRRDDAMDALEANNLLALTYDPNTTWSSNYIH